MTDFSHEWMHHKRQPAYRVDSGEPGVATTAILPNLSLSESGRAPAQPARTNKGRPKKRRRRARGEGSVYPRESDNKWVAAIDWGYTSAGKPRKKHFYGETQQEAIAKRDAFKQAHRCAPASGDGAKIKLSDFLDRWFARKNLRPSTRRRYQQIIDLRIKPFLGGVPLEKLDRQTLEIWLVQLATHPKGGKTADRSEQKEPISLRGQEMAWKVLNTALNAAEREGLIKNPLKKVESLPRSADPVVNPMTHDQLAAFLEAAKQDRYYTLYLLAVDSGMREAELFGLARQKVNLEAGTVTVERQVTENGRSFELPKTPKGKRTIALSKTTVAALKAYESRPGFGLADGLFFVSPKGNVLRRPNFLRRSFLPTLRRAGLSGFRFHDLRHTCATLLLQARENIKVVSERLGHADVMTTLRRYFHVMPGMQEQAAQAMGSILDDAEKKGRALEATRKKQDS
jgi:integrase